MLVSSLVGRLLLDAGILGVLIFVVARHNTERDLLSLLLVAGGTSIGGMVINALLSPQIGVFSFVVTAVLCGVLLIKVTGTNLVQAAIIVASFFAVKIGLTLALEYVFSNT